MAGEVVRTKTFVPDAANFVVDLAHKALAERNEFRIALSGGNTPRPVYSEIARIARDLHDDLGTALTGLALQLDVARREAGNNEPVAVRFSQSAEQARDLADRMR